MIDDFHMKACEFKGNFWYQSHARGAGKPERDGPRSYWRILNVVSPNSNQRTNLTRNYVFPMNECDLLLLLATRCDSMDCVKCVRNLVTEICMIQEQASCMFQRMSTNKCLGSRTSGSTRFSHAYNRETHTPCEWDDPCDHQTQHNTIFSSTGRKPAVCMRVADC
jgi:hypothetical protein